MCVCAFACIHSAYMCVTVSTLLLSAIFVRAVASMRACVRFASRSGGVSGDDDDDRRNIREANH